MDTMPAHRFVESGRSILRHRSFRHYFSLLTAIGGETVLWAMVGTACFASASAMADSCESYWTAEYKCMQGCGPCAGSSSGSGNSTPSYDYGAAQRAHQAAADAEAERQRQQADADRIEQERLAEEKRKKDADFIRNRDNTVLKGSVGASVFQNNGALKGGSLVSSGLKELSPRDRPTPGLQGDQAAWKQLHCAAALSGYAFAAVKQSTPDYQESSFLLAQASNALNGQSLNVECPAAPAFPDMRSRAVDMNQVRESEKTLINRAVVVVERMKQRNAPATVLPETAKKEPETSDDKLRRVQRELNQANSQKISGKTKAEIDAQEQDRKELTKLILANERLEKGELISVVADTGQAADTPRSRRKPVAVPAPN
jgi:hypothetical protein